ncbi:unnamed protein product [Protopolystoma xenopodis]|uniref:Uncharacterized protein n=1 Tax=Protopolystoma xenopodis TaxID=117903 RepID=A0A3S5CNI2_9PLAT|nr:unnamed protein product [Protopolystoma xenopodis]
MFEHSSWLAFVLRDVGICPVEQPLLRASFRVQTLAAWPSVDGIKMRFKTSKWPAVLPSGQHIVVWCL